eukprot:6556423-Ditylum_brightwellii.AAC.1
MAVLLFADKVKEYWNLFNTKYISLSRTSMSTPIMGNDYINQQHNLNGADFIYLLPKDDWLNETIMELIWN